MRDTPVHIANEQLKSFVGIAHNLATALIAAAAAQSWSDGAVTLVSGSWLLAAGIVMYVGWQLLTLLQVEE